MVVNNLLALVITGLYDIANGVISVVCKILPTLDFDSILSTKLGVLSPYISGLNYFVPISEMLSIGLAWTAAIAIWYVVQFILRFIRLGD